MNIYQLSTSVPAFMDDWDNSDISVESYED